MKSEEAQLKTIDAEAQYSSMCRILEKRRKIKFKKIVSESPLYLWTLEKYKKCMEYYGGNTQAIDVATKLKFPITMVNPEASVTILNHDVDDDVATYEMLIVASVPDTDDKITSYVHGILKIQPQRGKIKFQASYEILNGEMYYIEDKKIQSTVDLKGSEYHDLIQATFKIYALGSIFKQHYIYRPRQIVVKEVPRKIMEISNHNNKSKIPRIHQREIHYILDPDEIIEIKREARELETEGTHASPVPHTRKSHVRTFRHERFNKMKGKSIPISEADIGVKPGEIIKARKIYHIVSVGT